MLKKNCKYYPCHDELKDCIFCFCPIYPCKIKETGGEWIYRKNGKYRKKIGEKVKKVWDCSDCNIIHNSIVVKIMRKLKSKKYLAWKKKRK